MREVSGTILPLLPVLLVFFLIEQCVACHCIETLLHILHEMLRHRFKYYYPVSECLKGLQNVLTLQNGIYKTSSC